MQILEPANEQNYERCGVWELQSRKKLDLFDLEIFLSEVRSSATRNSDSSFGVERKTVLVIEMNHFGDLPKEFAQKMAGRAYDFAASQGVRMKSADPTTCVSGMALIPLEVRE